MNSLATKQYVEPLKKYISSGKPFMGICIGLQTMFEGSEENPGVLGLGIIPGIVKKLDKNDKKSIPHMGWNKVTILLRDNDNNNINDDDSDLFGLKNDDVYYFVHSYAVPYSDSLLEWTLSTTQYGSEIFISSIQKDNIFCTQ